MNYYSLKGKTETELTILTIYYSFTTLSTVGFGDYAPRSDTERLVISFILPCGVAIFSYIMGIFIDILNEFNAIHSGLEGDDEL